MEEHQTGAIESKSATVVVSKRKSIFTDVVHLAGLSSDTGTSINRDSSILDLRTKSATNGDDTPSSSNKSSLDASASSTSALKRSMFSNSFTSSAFASPTFFTTNNEHHHFTQFFQSHPPPQHNFQDFMPTVFGAQSTATGVSMPLCWTSNYAPNPFLAPIPLRSQFPLAYNLNSIMDTGISMDSHLMQSTITSVGASASKTGTTANVVSQLTAVSSKAKQAPRFQCPDCNRVYSTFSGLSKHRQFHCSAQLKRQFGCKFCQKHYNSLGALKMHIRTHTLPCKCELCGKAFSRPWLLQGHVRTHTGEKPFRCLHCGRAFADRSNLRAHLQTHSDVKKYRCVCCQKTFSRMSLLTKHETNGCNGANSMANS